MFTVALFTIAQMWKQAKCPLTEQQIKKVRYTHRMEYYSATERVKQCHLQRTPGMDPEIYHIK